MRVHKGDEAAFTLRGPLDDGVGCRFTRTVGERDAKEPGWRGDIQRVGGNGGEAAPVKA